MSVNDIPESDYVFSIHDDDHKLVVGIRRDGYVELGPGATGVDDAAMTFYQAVAEIIDRMEMGEDLYPTNQRPS